jgi:putative phosphoribosyl transferase
MFFTNRCDAGRRLVSPLRRYQPDHPLVLGLPRGGIVVAFEVAHALGAPLDVLVVRKLGAPDHPELAIGAVAPNVTVLDQETIDLLAVSQEYLSAVLTRERQAMSRMLALFRGQDPFPKVECRTVIIVDDGVATGSTALAAADAVRQGGANRVIVAVPVCAPESIDRLRQSADDVVFLEAPPDFRAVGYWYADFTQTSDDEVRQLLKRSQLESKMRFHPSVGT